MKKWKSLRGREAIHQVKVRGRNLKGDFVYCFFQLRESCSPGIDAGFAVARKSFSAARRNRLKRLMREALRLEQDSLINTLLERKCHASILFLFKGKKGHPVTRTRLDDVRKDIAMFNRSVVLKL